LIFKTFKVFSNLITMSFNHLQAHSFTRSHKENILKFSTEEHARELTNDNFLTECVSLEESTTPQTPWWLKLGGARFTTNGIRWRIWQVIYFIGVWGMGIWTLIYVLKKENPSVFAVFVVIMPESSELLRTAQKVVTTVFCISHLWIHIWVVRTRWDMPRLSEPFTPHKYNRVVLGYLVLLVAVLISGNLINPGHWPMIVNLVVWGLCGAIFVWYPFILPFAMFIADCQTLTIRLDSFQQTVAGYREDSRAPLTEADIKGVTAYYFLLAKSISIVNDTFRIILPIQLLNLALALFTNISQTVVSGNEPGESFRTDFMTMSLVFLMLVQLVAPLYYAARCNSAGNRVLRTLALYPELIVLVQQTVHWMPYIRLCGAFNGFKITYKSMLYGVPLIVYYTYSIIKRVGPDIFDNK